MGIPTPILSGAAGLEFRISPQNARKADRGFVPPCGLRRGFCESPRSSSRSTSGTSERNLSMWSIASLRSFSHSPGLLAAFFLKDNSPCVVTVAPVGAVTWRALLIPDIQSVVREDCSSIPSRCSNHGACTCEYGANAIRHEQPLNNMRAQPACFHASNGISARNAARLPVR